MFPLLPAAVAQWLSFHAVVSKYVGSSLVAAAVLLMESKNKIAGVEILARVKDPHAVEVNPGPSTQG